MSQKTDGKTRQPKAPRKDSSFVSTTLIIRLIIASVIFVFSLILDVSKFIGIVILALSALCAGYDIVRRAVDNIEAGEYFETPVIVTFITIVSFFIGFASEGAALIILYQIGLLLLNYAIDRTKKSASELLPEHDSELAERLKTILSTQESTHTSLEDTMGSSSGFILKIAMIAAVVYAVTLPIFTSFSYSISIHRALMIILIATPMSVTASIPLCNYVGMCYCASQGVAFNDASVMEAVADSSVVIFDKSGIFAEETPKIVAMHSDKLDSKTFLNLIAHAVYYSEQPLAKAICDAFEQDYQLDVIKDFRELPSGGVVLSIEDMEVMLATAGYLQSRDIQVPQTGVSGGTAYYMVVAGRCFGWVVVSSEVNHDAEQLIPGMKSVGFERCVLLSDEGKDQSREFAETMGFSEMYPECDTEKKLAVIERIASKTKGSVLYIYSSGINTHSAATVDLRVCKKGKYSDGLVDPLSVNNLPFSKQVASRVRAVSVSNAVFAFVIKAILIFLSIIGFCNLWFAIFLDMIAAVASVLFSIRVTSESIADTVRYKIGK